MTSCAEMKLVILWEGELRAAAKALKEAATGGTQEKWVAAMMCCSVALEGLDDDSCIVMVSSDTLRKHKKEGK